MIGHFLDTSVVAVAAGADHPQRAACRSFLEQHRDAPLHASVELLQEFVFHRLRRAGRTAALAETRRVRSMLVLHDFTAEILDDALQLIETTHLRGRDAVHVATARAQGFTEIVSLDVDFDGLTVIQRRDPLGPPLR